MCQKEFAISISESTVSHRNKIIEILFSN